jgi:hypothetical protein
MKQADVFNALMGCGHVGFFRFATGPNQSLHAR